MLSRFLVPLFILCFAWPGFAGEEVWTEVRSPNFVVISNASVKQARRTARLLERYRLLIRTVMVDSKVAPPAPLTVFAAKDEKSFKSLLAEERQPRGTAKKTGWFLPGLERSLAALRIDAPGDQTYHVVYHEYIQSDSISHRYDRLDFFQLRLESVRFEK